MGPLTLTQLVANYQRRLDQAIFKMQEAVLLAKKVDNNIQEHMRTLRKKQIAEMEKVRFHDPFGSRVSSALRNIPLHTTVLIGNVVLNIDFLGTSYTTCPHI